MTPQVLVVDDDQIILQLVEGVLTGLGHTVFSASTAEEALKIFAKETIDVAVLDFMLPDLSGQELFQRMRRSRHNLPAIFITGSPDLEQAVELMKLGACDYLQKPVSPKVLISRLEHVIKMNELATEVDFLRENSSRSKWSPGGFLNGVSPAMAHVQEQISDVAQYPGTTVLLTGPTGTGKSVVARSIHAASPNAERPFVEIDCSTIPRELCESELFGHEKGSFTGAHRSRPGLFEAAGEGCAFLDEIGELEAPLQAKLLRVLESRVFKRVGGQVPIKMSARVIAATNRSLPDMVRENKFREDLYFRLNVYEIDMPPLQTRGDDIMELAHQFLRYYSEQYKKPIGRFSSETEDYLRQHDFPGNVRELRNTIERSVIRCKTNTLEIFHAGGFKPSVAAPTSDRVSAHSPESGPQQKTPQDNLSINDAELRLVEEAMATANGNKSKAAELLGLSRRAFYRRLEKHGLD